MFYPTKKSLLLFVLKSIKRPYSMPIFIAFDFHSVKMSMNVSWAPTNVIAMPIAIIQLDHMTALVIVVILVMGSTALVRILLF
jgi:hypothetical protein